MARHFCDDLNVRSTSDAEVIDMLIYSRKQEDFFFRLKLF